MHNICLGLEMTCIVINCYCAHRGRGQARAGPGRPGQARAGPGRPAQNNTEFRMCCARVLRACVVRMCSAHVLSYIASTITVAILAQGTSRAVAVTQAFCGLNLGPQQNTQVLLNSGGFF